MKTVPPLLLLLLLCVSYACSNKSSSTHHVIKHLENGFNLISDTVNISVDGQLSEGIVFKDRYYCHFETLNTLGNERRDSFYIFDTKGNTPYKTPLPYDMQQYYNDIHIRHDSIIAKTYYDDTPCYYLDEHHKKWLPVKTVDDVIFEDENYYITSLDFGEWGGATWFKDKKTGIEYEAEMVTPEVRKIRNEYYLITPQSLDLIKDPKKLLEVGINAYSQYTGKDALSKFYERKRPGFKGVENIFKDSNFYTRSNFRIYASFVYNSILYLIVRDNTKTNIVKLSNNKLVKVANLDEPMYMSNNSNAYRGFSSRNTYTFANKDKRLGILEINGKNICLHYINNTPPKK